MTASQRAILYRLPVCIGCCFGFRAFGLLIAWDRTAAGLIRIAAENVIDPIWFAPFDEGLLESMHTV